MVASLPGIRRGSDVPFTPLARSNLHLRTSRVGSAWSRTWDRFATGARPQSDPADESSKLPSKISYNILQHVILLGLTAYSRGDCDLFLEQRHSNVQDGAVSATLLSLLRSWHCPTHFSVLENEYALGIFLVTALMSALRTPHTLYSALRSYISFGSAFSPSGEYRPFNCDALAQELPLRIPVTAATFSTILELSKT